ncbi:MAG: NfeD family protein [Selenomonadaceae bacterium]|nr:NfeD family protein [Selenomonadaceae bacterium]
MLDINLGASISAMILSVGFYTMTAVFLVGIFMFALIENYGSGKKDNLMDGLVLDEKQRNRDGYTGTKNKAELLGAIAVCATDLRPAGTVTVEGDPVDVVTEGDFVKKGDIVKIIKVDSSRVLVRRI